MAIESKKIELNSERPISSHSNMQNQTLTSSQFSVATADIEAMR